MQYRLKHRLGQIDAKKCNDTFGASLSLDAKDLGRGCIIDLNEKSFAYLTGKKPGLGHIGLLEAVDSKPVKAVAKDPAVTGLAK